MGSAIGVAVEVMSERTREPIPVDPLKMSARGPLSSNETIRPVPAGMLFWIVLEAISTTYTRDSASEYGSSVRYSVCALGQARVSPLCENEKIVVEEVSSTVPTTRRDEVSFRISIATRDPSGFGDAAVTVSGNLAIPLVYGVKSKRSDRVFIIIPPEDGITF